VILRRNYVVLTRDADGRWLQFTAVYARSKADALEQATATGFYNIGTFRVVTARAWGREYTRGEDE